MHCLDQFIIPHQPRANMVFSVFRSNLHLSSTFIHFSEIVLAIHIERAQSLFILIIKGNFSTLNSRMLVCLEIKHLFYSL